MLKYSLLLTLMFFQCVFGSDFLSYKGQLYISGYNNQDVLDPYDANINYLPEFYKSFSFNSTSSVDLKYSHSFYKNLSIDNFNKIDANRYRSWIRFSTNYIDLRFGLQKITFGSALFLRPLSWFDSIDFKSKSGQTYGVESLRFIASPSNSISVWLWSINNEFSKSSFGGRLEISNVNRLFGDWGFTYYKDLESKKHLPYQISQFLYSYIPKNEIIQPINLESILGFRENSRFGIDYRYDGLFGFWFEGSYYSMKKYEDVLFNEFSFLTLGFDYTFPILNGLLFTTETIFSMVDLSIDSEFLDNSNSSSIFFLSLPINIYSDFSYFYLKDWDDNIPENNIVRWSTTYDSFSMNYILTLIPGKLNDIFQIEFIYNH